MNFFDCWKTLNECFDESNLTALTQLVGYKLFAVANELKFPESFLLTDRELMSRTNIKSGQTIVEARRQLKNAGLIDFETKKARPTRYRFTINQATIKQDSSNNQARFKQDSSKIENPYIRAREDVKTLDSLSVNHLSTRGREISELDTIFEYWERDLRGGRLSFEHQGQIAAWLAQHGVEWLKAAMRETSDANGNSHGLSFKLLRAVIDRKLNPPQKPKLRLLKGCETSGKREHQYAKPPEYDFLDEWEQRKAANPVE